MNNPVQDYQRQEILSASPTKLISILYDFAIQACYQNDTNKLQNVLDQLINSLNFDYELADSLYDIYEYCKRQAKKKEFEVPRILIEDLRDTWNDHVLSSENKTPQLAKNGYLV